MEKIEKMDEINEVAVTYFSQMFNRLYNERLFRLGADRIEAEVEGSVEDRVERVKQHAIDVAMSVMYDVCLEYLALSKSNIEVIPKETEAMINLILNEGMQDNAYREAFLFALPLMYATVFEQKYGVYPIIWSTEGKGEEDDSYLEVRLTPVGIIDQCDVYNMDMLEGCKVLGDFFWKEYNGIQGLIQKVKMVKRVY